MGRALQTTRAPGAVSGAMVTETIPPLARRPVVSPAMALREEINDSWRLLVGTLGAALLMAGFLFTLAAALG